MILAKYRHEQFARMVADGESATAAYRAVYKASGRAAEAHGCRLVKNGKVAARVAELREASATAFTLTLAKKREMLHAFATDDTLDVRDRLRAIELDAKLAGELKGDSVTVSASASVSGNVMTDERRERLRALKQMAIQAEAARLDLTERHLQSVLRRVARNQEQSGPN